MWSRNVSKGKPVFSFPEAARLLGTSLELPDSGRMIEGASLDTRTLKDGNLFIAVRGAKDDGHRHLEEAFRKNASGALVEKNWLEQNRGSLQGMHNLLAVEDTAAALVAIAAAYRSRFNIKVVGITGSIGKTSTKEFLAYLLSKKFKVLATAGNFNNHLGLPLTILRLREGDQVCVAELGANHQGEIRFLAGILKPDLAAITKIAPVHLEGFGSLEGIYKAKTELLEALPPGSSAVLPDDDPILVHRAEQLKLKIVLAGDSWRAHYKISDMRTEDGKVRFWVTCKKEKREFSFPGAAVFLARNAAMAIALAEQCGMAFSEVPSDWSDMKLPSGRFEERRAGGVRFIYDGYNASPAAFDAALETFAGLKTEGRKYLVFSDMLELGPEEKKYHEQLGERIARTGIPALCYGSRAKWAWEAARAQAPALETAYFENAAQLAEQLNAKLRSGDAVLLKASRGMKIEEVFEWIQSRQETSASRR